MDVAFATFFAVLFVGAGLFLLLCAVGWWMDDRKGNG